MLHLQNLLTRGYKRTQSMSALNGKKPRPMASYEVDILPLPTTLRPGDFQETILEVVSHASNEGSYSNAIGDGLYPAAGNDIPTPPPIPTKEAHKYVRNTTPKNHNTPTSPMEHYELNTELLFDILRSHCESGGGTNRTRFVTSLYVTNLYAHTGAQYPPKFHDLDIDILLEILRYYVACQTDGVFILMLLSTAWSEFVLNSPILWQWITIDSLSPDWVEKAGYCHSLSAAYPLQIVLRLPMSDWSHVTPLLSKCGNMFIEVPDYIPSKDVEGMTGELLAAAGSTSCRIHWYRAGEELLTESREPITIDLLDVTTLHLEADGSEHPQYHVYAQTRDTRYRERGDEYHPLVLLKPFHVLQVLQNAYYLRRLAISHHSMDPIFLDLDLPLVTMIHLQHLEINDVDLTRNGVLSPFVQSFRCPALSALSLSGNLADIVATLQYCNEIGHPHSLNLCVEKHEIPESHPLRPSILSSVVSLSLHIVSPGLKNHQTQFLIQYLNVFTKTLHGLMRVNFVSTQDWFEDTTPPQMLSTSGWGRFNGVVFESLNKKTRSTVLNYHWDATQSSMTIESKTPHVFELLDTLAETKDPHTLHLMLENDNAPVFRSPTSRPSVKTLHLQIGQCRNQLQTIQYIRSLLEALPNISEIYLNLHPTLSEWTSPYSMVYSAQRHKIRVSTTRARDRSNTISILDHTLACSPSITFISRVSDSVMAFASVLGSLGSLSVTQVAISQHQNSSNQIHCLRITEPYAKKSERHVRATASGRGSSSALALQLMGACLGCEERISIGESIDQAVVTLHRLIGTHLRVPPDKLMTPPLLGHSPPYIPAVFESVNIGIERQNLARPTTAYAADRNTTIMSISGAGVLVLQLLKTLREQGCPLWNFRTGDPIAPLVLLTNTSITCLRLHIRDTLDAMSTLECAESLIETLPQLCELHFTVPPKWWRFLSGPHSTKSDRYPNLKVCVVNAQKGGYPQPLAPRNGAKRWFPHTLLMPSNFWKFSRMLDNVRGHSIPYEAPKAEGVDSKIFANPYNKSKIKVWIDRINAGSEEKIVLHGVGGLGGSMDVSTRPLRMPDANKDLIPPHSDLNTAFSSESRKFLSSRKRMRPYASDSDQQRQISGRYNETIISTSMDSYHSRRPLFPERVYNGTRTQSQLPGANIGHPSTAVPRHQYGPTSPKILYPSYMLPPKHQSTTGPFNRYGDPSSSLQEPYTPYASYAAYASHRHKYRPPLEEPSHPYRSSLQEPEPFSINRARNSASPPPPHQPPSPTLPPYKAPDHQAHKYSSSHFSYAHGRTPSLATNAYATDYPGKLLPTNRGVQSKRHTQTYPSSHSNGYKNSNGSSLGLGAVGPALARGIPPVLPRPPLLKGSSTSGLGRIDSLGGRNGRVRMSEKIITDEEQAAYAALNTYR